MVKKIVAVLAGTIVMVILDLLIARFITASLTIGISASVLIGALVASLIVEKHEWSFGLLVGIVNCCITLGVFYLFSPQGPLREYGYSMADVVVRPMALSLVFGIVGGVIGRYIKIISRTNKDKIAV